MLSPEALIKLDKFLSEGCEKAVSEGMTIVDRGYHPFNNCCCPIYAACKEERYQNIDIQSNDYPLYEKIISEHIGEAFDLHHLQSFLAGFDSDIYFWVETHELFKQRDRGVFNIGRKLREKYILTVPPEKELSCLTDTEAKKMSESGEMPSAMLSHLSWCNDCHTKIENAISSQSLMGSTVLSMTEEMQVFEEVQWVSFKKKMKAVYHRFLSFLRHFVWLGFR